MRRLVVYHTGYGCDTGCCGHSVTYEDDNGTEHEEFAFSHLPRGIDKRDPLYRQKIIQWVKKEFDFDCLNVEDLDWENCLILENC
jgi:hypothetical protein